MDTRHPAEHDVRRPTWRRPPVSVLVAAALVFSSMSAIGPAPASGAAGFGDVAVDSVHAPAIQWLAEAGVTTGTSPGCYSPNAPVTRAQLATFLWRLEGSPAGGAHPLGDVAGGTYFSDAVGWLWTAGLTSGTSPTIFSPFRVITRAEIATFLWRLAGEPLVATASRFDDVVPTAYYRDAVDWLAAEAITTGTSPNRFSPDRALTRAEAASFLYRSKGSPTVTTSTTGFCVVTGDSTGGNREVTTITEPAGASTTTSVPVSSTSSGSGTTSTTTASPSTTTTQNPPSTTSTSTSTTSTSTTTTTTTNPTSGDGYFETLPPGAMLPSGEWCAARVRPAPETRSMNVSYNQTRGTEAHPGAPRPLYARVDGDFTGTTDEILQWAACKWGIDEDVVRAQVAKESWWNQQAQGDFTSNTGSCHPSVRYLDPCPESLGILQVRYDYHTPAMDNSIASTAYNADYTYAAWRSCYNGDETWFNQFERGGTYVAGDLWGCIGAWFSGRWRVPAALEYIDAVQGYLDDRVWEQDYFLNYNG